MNSLKILTNISKALFIVFIPVVILLTALQYYSFNQDFYMRQFRKYDISTVTTMNEKDLGRVSEKIISYLRDEDDNLNIEAVIQGKTREVFGEREKLHMVDVKDLFLRGYDLRNISALIALISLVAVLLLSNRKARDLYQTLFLAGVIPIILMVVLSILLTIDFNKYFNYFHEIFFTNDLWLLNPETEVLIQMLPLGFFIDISSRVISWFLGISAVMTITSFIKLKKISKA